MIWTFEGEVTDVHDDYVAIYIPRRDRQDRFEPIMGYISMIKEELPIDNGTKLKITIEVI